MYKNILFLGISLCASFAMAADNEFTAFAKRADALTAPIDNLAAQIRANRVKIATIESNVAKAEQKMRDGTVTKTIRTCVETSWYLPDDCKSEGKIEVPKDLKEAYDAAKTEEAQIKSLKDQNAKLMSEKDKIEADRNRLRTQGREQLAQGNNLDSLLSDLDGKLNRNETHLLSSELILAKVAAKYDNTVAGAYMRAKMAELLASDSMCKAQEMCTNKVPKANKLKTFQDSLGVELFKRQALGEYSTTTTVAPSSAR